jgi:hypothetical protein
MQLPKIPEGDVKIIGCIPCLAGMQLGLVPYKGSTVEKCSKCGDRVWLGPEQKKLADTGWPIICFVCIRKIYGDEAINGIFPLTNKRTGE